MVKSWPTRGAGTPWLRKPASTGGGVTLVNVNRAITYTTPNMGGFGATVQVAEADENGGLNANTADGTAALNNSAKRPYSFGASYAGGPLSVGFGYANPGNVNDNWLSLRGSYDLGAVKLWGFIGNGKKHHQRQGQDLDAGRHRPPWATANCAPL